MMGILLSRRLPSDYIQYVELHVQPVPTVCESERSEWSRVSQVNPRTLDRKIDKA
jgi:hypothetical protein